jgi:hypothetical protein
MAATQNVRLALFVIIIWMDVFPFSVRKFIFEQVIKILRMVSLSVLFKQLGLWTLTIPTKKYPTEKIIDKN